MATSTITPAIAGSNPSLILNLHARYEATMDEYERLETAQPAKPAVGSDTWQVYHLCEDGMQMSWRETQLIQRAVLWQVPSTFEEATVLAYHMWSLYDRHTELTDEEKEALEIALTSLFDFLASEGCAEKDNLGDVFSRGTELAFQKRRARTGIVAA